MNTLASIATTGEIFAIFGLCLCTSFGLAYLFLKDSGEPDPHTDLSLLPRLGKLDLRWNQFAVLPECVGQIQVERHRAWRTLNPTVRILRIVPRRCNASGYQLLRGSPFG